MNKKYRVVQTAILITLLILTSGANAADNNESKVKQFVLDKIKNQLEIEVESTANLASSKVFSCSFYKVTP